ncbi:MAG: NAD(P)/FAD-dependent oxidoreductase [Clostridia bacterium]|nr:NAD(P)/FAD-dependent oxidoreductase [Clostridia bacterium]
MADKKFLVLGGGLGGVVAARELRRQVGKEHSVTLIDRRDEHIFLPSLPWIMTGDMESFKAKKDLRVLEKKGINFIHAEVQKIDLRKKRVETTKGNYDYNYLIISLGARLEPENIPGLKEASINIYELEGMENLRRVLRDFKCGRVVVLVCSILKKCAAASIEIPFLLDHFFVKQGIRDKVDLRLVTPDPYPLPYLTPSLGKDLQEKMEARGIVYSPRSNVREIRNNKIYLEHGDPVPFDLLLTVPPHYAADVVEKSNLTGKSGWIEVDPETMWTGFEGVYAIGDIISIPLPAGGFMDKTGLLAELQAKVVTSNLSRAVRGEKMDNKFSGKGMCLLETGFGKALFFGINFFNPIEVNARIPLESRAFRLAKVMFFKYWFPRWF